MKDYDVVDRKRRHYHGECVRAQRMGPYTATFGRPYLRLDVIDGADSGLSPEASVQATLALLVRPGEFAKSPSQPWIQRGTARSP